MSYVYAHLKTPQNTGSGISEFFLIAPVSDFVSIKSPAAPFVNPGDEVRILEAHEFQANKGFARVALAPEKNSLTAKTIGDLMFQKQDFELKVFIPGTYAEVHEAFKNWINTPLIVMTKDSNCAANLWYQLGNDCTYAYLKGDFSTGTTKDGVKGYDATISWQNPYVQFYSHVDGPEELA